jgi:hypothetical protein
MPPVPPVIDWPGWLQGLLSGAGVVLLWEGLLKPRRDRRNLARVLTSEVSRNTEMIANTVVYCELHPRQIPVDFALATGVFDATVDRAGEFPVDVIGELVLFYMKARHLERTLVRYEEAVDGYQAIPEYSAAYADRIERDRLKADAEEAYDAFLRGLPSALENARPLLHRLHRVAHPIGRFFMPERTIDRKELEAAMRKRYPPREDGSSNAR